MLPSIPRINKTKAKMAKGEVPFGIFLPSPSPMMVEFCGILGLDFVIIDGEGGALDFVMAEDLVRAAETVDITPVVRTLSHDPKAILRYLDCGFQGLMVPGVDTAQQARDIVAAAKFAPEGNRGFGRSRAGWYGLGPTPLGEFSRTANEQVLIIAMLEHISALKEIDEIIKVPGIDSFEIGPWDLSASMGLAGQTSHPEVVAAIDKIIETVTKAGKCVGDTIVTPGDAKELVDRGFGMLNCSFAHVFGDALRELTSSVRTHAGTVKK